MSKNGELGLGAEFISKGAQGDAGADRTSEYEAAANRTTARQAAADRNHDLSLKLTARVRSDYKEFKEANAYLDPDNVAAAKVLYKMNSGGDFEGSDEDATKYAIEEMGRFNHSFFQADFSNGVDEQKGMVGYATQMMSDETTDLEKLAFIHLVESYDAMDADNWDELGRFGRAMVGDPTNYTGLGALAGMGIKWGAKKAGGSAFMHALKAGLKVSALGAAEGGAFGAGAADQIQRARIAATDNAYIANGEQYSTDRTITEGAIGATFGALLPHAPAAIKNMWKGTGWIVDKTAQQGTLGMGVGPIDKTPVDGSVVEAGKKIYHGTSDLFDDFDVSKSADGSIWFTDNKSKILSGDVGASTSGNIMERMIDEGRLKLATWDDADKYSTGQLIDQGFDGVKMAEEGETTYQIFNPEKLSKVDKTPVDGSVKKIDGGIDVYHGTAKDFEPTENNPLGEFRKDFTGSGDGAAASGSGTYTAEMPDEARTYRDMMLRRSGADESMYVGETKVTDIYRQLEDQGEYDKLDAMERLMLDGDGAEIMADISTGETHWPEYVQEWFVEEIAPDLRTAGSLYNAKFNTSEDKLINWDSTFAQQPSGVKSAMLDRYSDILSDYVDSRNVVRMRHSPDKPPYTVDDLKGGDVYRAIALSLHEEGSDFNAAQQAASSALSEIGIDGVKVKDSKAKAGVGTGSNYVAFDPRSLEIISKYGIAGLAIGLSAEQNNEEL